MRIPLIITLLAVAVASDMLHRKIPNRLVLAGLLAGGACALFDTWQGRTSTVPILGGPLVLALAGAAAGLLGLMPLYLLRACGAGDVKLMAAVGALVGPATVWQATVYTLLAGGVLSLVVMLLKGITARTLDNVWFLLTDLVVRVRSGQGARIEPLAVTAARLPYAIAIAAGTGLALLQRGSMA